MKMNAGMTKEQENGRDGKGMREEGGRETKVQTYKRL
jgi:hypothetical protein